jgi:UDP-N-acetyl-D-mannosaminuronic acid transferase (WecB/TagA/CpsF family)
MPNRAELAIADGMSIVLTSRLFGKPLRERYPELLLADTDCPPHDFENDPIENERVIERICKARIAANASRRGVGVAMPLGGSFEVIGGLLPSAPRLLQRLGLEWLFHLMIEPRRLCRRYLIGNRASWRWSRAGISCERCGR